MVIGSQGSNQGHCPALAVRPRSCIVPASASSSFQGASMVRVILRSAAVAALAIALAGATAAQDRRQNRPGQFDFYVLSLSWSPSFCEASGERGTPPRDQC